GLSFTYVWTAANTDRGGTPSAPFTGQTFNFTPNDDGHWTVSVTATGSDGSIGTATAAVTVFNVAPAPLITGLPAVPPGEGSPITLGSTVADPSTADTAASFAYAWSVTKNGNPFPASGSNATFSFTPDDNAAYVVKLTAKDKDGGLGTTSATI